MQSERWRRGLAVEDRSTRVVSSINASRRARVRSRSVRRAGNGACQPRHLGVPSPSPRAGPRAAAVWESRTHTDQYPAEQLLPAFQAVGVGNPCDADDLA